MLKKLIQVSSLVCTLAMASWIPANASSNEEDAAAPVGSFTSDMSVPASLNFEATDRRVRHERFAMRFRNELLAGERGGTMVKVSGDCRRDVLAGLEKAASPSPGLSCARFSRIPGKRYIEGPF